MKRRKLIFMFKLLAVLDVLFSRRFELTTYYRYSALIKSKTKFDKDEILNSKPNKRK